MAYREIGFVQCAETLYSYTNEKMNFQDGKTSEKFTEVIDSGYVNNLDSFVPFYKQFQLEIKFLSSPSFAVGTLLYLKSNLLQHHYGPVLINNLKKDRAYIEAKS